MDMNSEPTEQIKWLTPEEAAQKMSVSVTTLYRYINQEEDKLPAYKISSASVRLDAREVDKWILNHSNKGIPLNPDHKWSEEDKGGPTYE